MLQIILILALVGVARDTTRVIQRNRAIFAEFGQTTAVRWLVWLYPVPLAILILSPPLTHYLLFPCPLGILFFIPAIGVATLNRWHFQRAGTDRADQAERAADRVVMSGILAAVCFLGVAVVLWLMQLLT